MSRTTYVTSADLFAHLAPLLGRKAKKALEGRDLGETCELAMGADDHCSAAGAEQGYARILLGRGFGIHFGSDRQNRTVAVIRS